MTTDSSDTQAPSSPTTEAERPATPAGRQLWHALVMMVRGIQKDELAHDIRAIEQQARDEGRREAVRIDPEVLAAAIFNCDLSHPVTFHVETVDVEAARIAAEYDRVAGLNASEPPPTEQAREWLRTDDGCTCTGCKERRARHKATVGDASESPPTLPPEVLNAEVEWVGDASESPRIVSDSYPSQIVGGTAYFGAHVVGDASESPPTRHDKGCGPGTGLIDTSGRCPACRRDLRASESGQPPEATR